MAEPATTTILTGLNSLWERGTTLLLSLGFICIATFAFLYFGPKLGVDTSDFLRSYGTYIGIGAIAFSTLGIAKIFDLRPTPSLRLFLEQNNSFAHHARQQDGRTLTQIVVRFSATNLTKINFRLMEGRLMLPKTSTPEINSPAVEDPHSQMYSSRHIVPAGVNRQASIDFMLKEQVGDAAKPLDIKIEIVDQRGQSAILKGKLRWV